MLEQSATVWQSSLSEENIKDLESVQKSAIRIMQKSTRYLNEGYFFIFNFYPGLRGSNILAMSQLSGAIHI